MRRQWARGLVACFLAATVPVWAIDLDAPFAAGADSAGDLTAGFGALATGIRRDMSGRGRAPAARAPRPWINWQGDRLTVNVAPQNFSPYDIRNQGVLGTCAAFGAIALVEAAYMRSGKCVRLSEADAFLQHIVFAWPCWATGSCLQEIQNTPGPMCSLVGRCERRLWQAGTINGYLEFFRQRGVMTGDHYKEFSDRFFSWITEPARWTGNNTRLNQMLSSLDNYRGVGSGRAAESKRAMVKAELAGWRVRNVRFPEAENRSGLSPQRCLVEGRRQAALMAAELEAGRPVGVGMSLTGLHMWDGTPVSGSGGHAFVVTGYRMSTGGQKTFMTRNSWGGVNPDVAEDQTCRIVRLNSVVRPAAGEVATF